MDYKLIIFFIVAVLLATYLHVFWDNRKEKITFHFFHRKTDAKLGLILLGVFLDGAIFALIFIWLMGYFG